MPEEQIIDSQAHPIIRGDASEHIITTLANIGAAHVSIEMDGIMAHQDIMVKDKLVIEL